MTIDSNHYRQVLGHYPTGVCAITTVHEGEPVGMIVGSFTSASLDPPLVAFFPDKKSATWPKVEMSGRFCVNVLTDNQHDVCRSLSSKLPNKFEALAYGLSDGGLPVFSEAAAWIDCTLHAVHEAGDHYVVLGLVQAMDVASPLQPMLFFRGGYHGLARVETHP